jgi:hypothetical protein
MKLLRRRALRLWFWALAVGMSMAFLAAFLHHVYRLDFKPMGALGVPILLLFFGFGSLFFIRGRSLAKGSAQLRSLFAAERAVQAALWHLAGIMLSTVLYALLMRSGVALQASATWLVTLWGFLFLLPHALSQIALFTFMRALLVVAPHLFRKVGAFEIRRRLALS